MKQEEWGIKRVCLSCGIKFYDFHKSPIICPACQTPFDVDYLTKKRQKNQEEKISEDDVEAIEITDIGDDIAVPPDDDIESLDDGSDALVELEEEKDS